jgi:cyclopropane-fatty-acyl-phospholipid synthase
MRFGAGAPVFRLHIRTARALRAFARLDEARVGRAYLEGDLDLDGDVLEALRLRPLLQDRHPLKRLRATWLRPRLLGRRRSDARAIAEHYDEDPAFFRLFLGPSRCYSHGVFADASEPLEKAMARKFELAIEACGLRAGMRVLDIGGGWGAFAEHAGSRGIRVTSLTISRPSEQFLRALFAREGLPCEVVREHFLAYRSEQPFDAIVNMGVTEHLPDYAATLARYQELLVPGGRVYLDASAGPRRFRSTSFVQQHVFPGDASTLCLHDYLRALSDTPFELLELHNDRESYRLTSLHWARNLERHRDAIVARWGETLFRKFHLFHWGCVYSFETRQLSAYRMVLRKPREERVNTRLDGGLF